MILRVDADSAVPVYEQLRTQLLTMIATGVLAPGTQLPTIRQLAADLGLAKGTVSKAYEWLLRDRAIESRGRLGTIVSGPAPTGSRGADVVGRLNEAAEHLAVVTLQAGKTDAEAHRILDDVFARYRAG
jgi:GntR family transcriptional regulator